MVFRSPWLSGSLHAVASGADVYAYLIGIMALAELARACGVFDWLASALLDAAADSRAKLFALVFALGTAVTILLSNDTTAVVLTPAISAAVRKTKAPPLPYLYACAFIANAASFVLPISNPANLVMYASHLPRAADWLGSFALSSVAAIALTYGALFVFFNRTLRGTLDARGASPQAPPSRTLAALMVGASAVALIVAAIARWDIGLTALFGALVSVGVIAIRQPSVIRSVLAHISWNVIALVAVLFAVVAAVDRAGALALLHHVLGQGNVLFAGVLLALADNAINNLPVALATGTALASAHATPAMTSASVIAVDLGPNLSISGSLATLLWIMALKRDGIRVTFGAFLVVGFVVTVPALLAALLLAR